MNIRETLQDVIYDSVYCLIDRYYNFKKQSIIVSINDNNNDNNIIQIINRIFHLLNENFNEEKLQLISNFLINKNINFSSNISVYFIHIDTQEFKNNLKTDIVNLCSMLEYDELHKLHKIIDLIIN